MSIQINEKLDPVYETIFLLYHGYDLEKYKDYLIKEINESGANGEEFYDTHYKVIDSYIQAFQKYRVPFDKDTFFFNNVSMDFFVLLISPYFVDRDFFNTAGSMKQEQILFLLLQNMDDILNQDLATYSNLTFEEWKKADFILPLINQMELSDNEKWKLLLVLQNPKEYYEAFTEIVKSNIPAFEKAVKAIKSSYDIISLKYHETFQNGVNETKVFQEFGFDKYDIHEVTPSLITACGIMFMEDTCYYGIVSDQLMDQMGLLGGKKEYLITCLKALSDKSKLEILATLKSNPKYSAELATQLGLTSATVSHHMSTLLTAKLVYGEKRNGKFYYHINEEVINDIMEQLRQII